MVADCTVKTDTLGDEGPPSPPQLDARSWLAVVAVEVRWLLVWHVEVEMAVAREMGMRQRPLPCRYCMAEPMSSSISFATWCSVTVMLSFVDAVCAPRPIPPPLLDCRQSPPP